MDTLCYTMRGIGMSLLPTVISLTGACLFRIVWIYTVFAAHHTQFVLYISYPISWTLTSVAYVICYLIIRKKRFSTEEPKILPTA
jgi:Na+-driven multidrug efflux pump